MESTLPVTNVSFANTADEDVGDLISYFASETKERQPNPEAIRKLLDALERAKLLLQSGQGLRRSFPATYDEMARPGEQWLKVHRYWFGYSRRSDEAVIFAIFDQSADMPRRR